MSGTRSVVVTQGKLAGLYFLHQYRYLTITQLAKLSGLSLPHTADVFRTFERRGIVGFFGYVAVPGQGRTPKVYF
jgi:hypothetical protein